MDILLKKVEIIVEEGDFSSCVLTDNVYQSVTLDIDIPKIHNEKELEDLISHIRKCGELGLEAIEGKNLDTYAKYSKEYFNSCE